MSAKRLAGLFACGALGVALIAPLAAQQGRGATPPPAPPAGAPAAPVAAPGGAGQGQGRGAGGGAPAVAPGALARPLRVYIRAGLKTHAVGQHDYPQFLADWSKILTERGAIVDGSLHFPTRDELANIDVIVTYKGDAGYMTPEEKANLDAFLKRGGGLVGLHDAICGDDTAYFSTITGGAKKHGETNFTLEAEVPYTIVDKAHPIMAGMTDFKITDEAFFLMTWATNAQKQPAINVLATAKIADTPSAKGFAGTDVPQMWTYERTIFGGQPYRSFVWMQGHNYVNFAEAQVQPMLLRAIAWAGRYPIDALSTVRAGRGGGGGRGRGGN